MSSRGVADRGGGYSLVRYLTLVFQFGLFLVVLHRLDLESRAFLHLGILAFFGFSVHYFLPLRWRQPFFVGLSLAGIALVFGVQLEKVSLAGLGQAAWIVGLGLVFVALVHLPLPFRWRLVAVLVFAGLLAAARGGLVRVPWSSAVWPVLGSLFMFRLIAYLYDLRHAKKSPEPRETLAYFFMLPNVCFPLFPVVDFQTFRRTYYDQPDRHRIYQTGIEWMLRGATHLIVYRFIYQNVVLGVTEVGTVPELLRYLVWPYLLYTRISGQFHIIIGLMHLFGYNLPRTNHFYYLASGFTDVWRRINIYWKDFMMKVVYYPAFFRLRKRGNTFALVVSTLLVFFATWALHGYQWFWIRGSWLLTPNDSVFWSVLGVLVVISALYEMKHGRRRTLTKGSIPWSASFGGALRTAGTFCAFTLLWSFWNAESVGAWLSVWGVLGTAAAPELLAGLAWLAGGLLVLGLLAVLASRAPEEREPGFTASAVTTSAVLLAVIALTLPPAASLLGPRGQEAVASLRRSELNRRDFALLERGYYEGLLNVGQFNHELWEVYRTRPEDWLAFEATEIVVWTDRLPNFVLEPSFSMRYLGAELGTNRWGMRDRDIYTRERPAGTHRIALLGASMVMGSGVGDGETFDNVLEDRLNRELAGGGYERYEVLNFAVNGYAPLDMLAILEHPVLDFEPQAVFFVAHESDAKYSLQRLGKVLRRSSKHPYGKLRDIARRAGVTPDMEVPVIERALKPYEEELLVWIYRSFVDLCRQRGALPVWVFLPRLEDAERGGPPPRLRRRAEEAGFLIFDLTGVYGERDLSSMWIARWDHHPNPEGHRRIADALFERMRGSETRFGLGGGRIAGTAGSDGEP